VVVKPPDCDTAIDVEEAAAAYERAARERFGEFARKGMIT
jgi:hypothetical protein